jgi:hypothetical protein
MDDDTHRACVNAWIARTAKGLPPERLLDVFERGFAALWRRAHRTLGGITLMAIVDRVLYVAAEQHPALSALKVDATGIQVRELRARAADLDRVQIEEAVRFVMVEFLTLVGNLTAEILTPALHAELSKLSGEEGPGPGSEPPDPAGKDGEGGSA